MMDEKLVGRSQGKCELTGQEGPLVAYEVAPATYDNNEIAVLEQLVEQLDGLTPLEPADWQALPTTMWSDVPAVQVAAWRVLNRLKTESWAADALDILYLDDETLEWAKAVAEVKGPTEVLEHKDSLGSVLQNGDAVVITRTLDVKGSSISAKLGTVVKNIRLVEDNPEQIEGRVEGQQIVILTKYVRKQN